MDKITFTGERYCKELFVGQAFCNFKCKNFESTQDITDCQNDRSLAKIDCSKFRLLGDGKTPESLFFTCTCTYNGVGQGACQTKEYQWSDAESLFDQYCSNTNNTAQASRAFDSITSQDGGRTIVSNQTTIYNNTLIYVMMPYGGKSRRKKIVLDAKSFNKSDELSPLLLEPIENLERFSASSDNPNEESTTYSTTTAETTTIVPEVTGETTTYVSTTSTRASSQSPNDFAV
uniref:Uncharacterized protein n=1 Tax=Romanomermis culicivorax TaxID=13658 RepID=A0A915KIB8_ROMCU